MTGSVTPGQTQRALDFAEGISSGDLTLSVTQEHVVVLAFIVHEQREREQEHLELIQDLRNALARERGGGSPLDHMSYILLHRMAGAALAHGRRGEWVC